VPLWWYLAALVLVAGFFALLLWAREPVAGALMRLAAPILSVRNALLSGEGAELRAQVEALSARVADRDLLYEENLHLKRLLGRDAAPEAVLAGVLQRPPGTPFDTLLIDAGRAEGVVRGSLVAAGGNALIGDVSEVYAHTARVSLFSSPGRTFEGLLYQKDGSVVPVVLEGEGGATLSTQVPVGTVVATGDAVVIPGIATGLFAHVVAVDSREAEAFTTLYLRLPANPYVLRTVEVRQQFASVILQDEGEAAQ
jgi:cell shape-determining protein MreC